MKIEIPQQTDRVVFIPPPNHMESTPDSRERLFASLPRLGPSATVLLWYVSQRFIYGEALDFHVEALCDALGFGPRQLAATLNRLERFGIAKLLEVLEGGIVVDLQAGALQ